MGLKLYRVTYSNRCDEVPPIVAEFTAESEEHIVSRFGNDLICFNRIYDSKDSLKIKFGFINDRDIEWDE